MSQGSLILTYPLIGANRYQYNGREGFYLNVIERYAEDDKNGFGCFQTAISAPYAESAKFLTVPMSLDAPATVELKCRLVSRAGNTSLVCDEVLKVTPFKAAVSKDIKDLSPAK